MAGHGFSLPRIFAYTGKYVSDKTRIQGYYTQCLKIKRTSKIYLSHALISSHYSTSYYFSYYYHYYNLRF